MSDTAVILGPYSQGEVPEPTVYTFLKSDGTPDPISGYTGKFEYRRWNTSTVVEKVSPNVTVAADASGQVTITWVTADMATFGDFEGDLWVGNNANKYRSVRLKWMVKPAVAVATGI
jgi:hypothetical protein